MTQDQAYDYLNKIEKQFLNEGHVSGRSIMFSPHVALKVLDECEKQRIEILGIDGIFTEGEGYRPSMDHSIDFTSISYPRKNSQLNTWNASREFICSHSKQGIFFEIVMDVKE